LENDRSHGDQAESANGPAIFFPPKPDGENDRKKTDRGRNQAMRMFKQYSADPFRNWKEKHVITERGRPIGDGETNTLACDHAAAADKKKRGAGRKPGKSVEPAGGGRPMVHI
jgi:hypothetical protein